MKTAFVAMKFTTSAADDQIYQRIGSVLAEAGYSTLRADELPTSGVVVEEVCRRLRESDMVVIDTSGDSHSVSYEVGYCHGIARRPEQTILLRASDADVIPFNYRHYRHRIYDSLAGLDRELRRVLGLSSPLSDDELTRHLTLVLPSKRSIPPGTIAKQLRRTLVKFSLSGRLEVYFDDGYLPDDGDLRPDQRAAKTPNGKRVLRLAIALAGWEHETMHDFSGVFISNMKDVFDRIEIDSTRSGDGVLAIARRSLRRLVVWDVVSGSITHVSFPQSDPLLQNNPGAQAAN